jgi:hypothetical protein
MKIPKNIDICGVSYTIELVEEIDHDTKNMGRIYEDSSRILLKKDMSKDKIEQTLIHEIVHGVLWETGVEDKLEDDQIERYTQSFTSALYPVIKQLIKENVMAKGKKPHPGFKAVQKEIAKKEGIPMQNAGAILANAGRNASPKAKANNPNLNKIKGSKKKGK